MADQYDFNVNTKVPNFIEKWRDLQPLTATAPPQAVNSVFDLDFQRLKAGQQPLSQNERILALRSASDLSNHLPEQHPHNFFQTVRNIPSAAVGDIKQIVQSIPQLPMALVHEAQALPQAPAAIAQGIEHGSIGEVAKAPGVRLLPGSFLAQNLSHPSNILKHPVMSALDVAPAIGEGIKFLPEEFKASIKGGLDSTLDNFGVGPASVGTNRIVNIARRQAERSVDQITNAANHLAKGLSPEHQALLKEALNSTDEFPRVSPELEGAFKQMKNYQEKLDSLHINTRATAMSSVANAFGKSADSLLEQFGPDVVRISEATGADPTTVFRSIMHREGLQEFKPHEIIPGLKQPEGAAVYVPKAVNEALTRLFNPHIKTGLGKANEQAMTLFRTAVLPLSLRWHLTNTAGMTAMVAAETGPGVLKYVGEARDMLKNHTLPVELGQPGIFGERGMAASKAEEFFHAQRGADIRKMLNEPDFTDYAAKLGKPLANVIDKSYRVANMVDHMGTALGYLYGKGKAAEKGLTGEAAHAAGIEMARRVMYDWDAITPVERQIVKTVFPFYGWMKTISKYVMKYPVHHPFRASFVSNLGRAEMEDQKSGIPEQYRQLLTIGKPDERGNQKGIDVKKFNPFSDVANIFTLGGLMGMLNPFAGAALHSIGINRTTGAAPAFPQTVYNPVTGRQEAEHQNYFSSLLDSFFPQGAAVGRVLGIESPQSKRLKLTNPEAYKDQFWSSLGLPLPQKVNLNKIAAQSEVNRYQAVSSQINQIVKSGNFEKLREFNDPRLDTIAARLEQLAQSGQLDQFKVGGQGQVAQLDPEAVLRAVLS